MGVSGGRVDDEVTPAELAVHDVVVIAELVTDALGVYPTPVLIQLQVPCRKTLAAPHSTIISVATPFFDNTLPIRNSRSPTLAFARDTPYTPTSKLAWIRSRGTEIEEALKIRTWASSLCSEFALAHRGSEFTLAPTN